MVAEPTPTAVAVPPLSMTSAFVLLDTQETVVGVGVAESVYVCDWETARAVVAGVIAEVGPVVGAVGELLLPQAPAHSAPIRTVAARNRFMNLVKDRLRGRHGQRVDGGERQISDVVNRDAQCAGDAGADELGGRPGCRRDDGIDRADARRAGRSDTDRHFCRRRRSEP